MSTLSVRQLCVIGLCSALLATIISATPVGRSLEENLGLFFLFKLRGQISPPDEAVVFAIEKQSAEYFGLKQQPYKWPRFLHARAVDKLTDMGTAAVCFDMFFEETRSFNDDYMFAEAMQNSGNVVLLQRVREIGNANYAIKDNHTPVHSEQLIPPVPLLEHASYALAPLPLPQKPIRVNQSWLFKEGTGNQATLPFVMFAMVVSPLFDKFMQIVKLTEPSFATHYRSHLSKDTEDLRFDTFLQDVRSVFLVEKQLKEKILNLLKNGKFDDLLDHNEKKMLTNIIRLFSEQGSVFINYYGPPGTITSYPYYYLFEESKATTLPDLANKAIFVGLTHEAEMGEKDGFYTVYTNEEGKHISGVEVAATLFANLIDGSYIRPLHPFLAVICIIIIGLAASALTLLFNPVAAGIVNLGLCCLYIMVATLFFAMHHFWMPVIIPVTLQVPATYMTLVLIQHRSIAQSKSNFQKALGCYLPHSIVKQIEKDFTRIAGSREISSGVCLYADMENYTTLSESTEQHELREIVNRYYEEIFQIIQEQGGLVLDIRGDAMLALWADQHDDNKNAGKACQAALSISQIFNSSKTEMKHRLPTRIGLHQGELSLGNIGALDHFQYTVTGDTVNTAARIESLCKQLGTKLLVSAEVANQSLNLEFREIGTFILVGKNKPIQVFEPIGVKGKVDDHQSSISNLFSSGLTSFKTGQWSKSLELFQECASTFSGYGPARFYLNLCKNYIVNPSMLPKNGVIVLAKK